MGLATIDPHSQIEHTEIHEVPKFGVNQASFAWDTVACEQAPSEVWKKDSASEERDSVGEASGTRGSL